MVTVPAWRGGRSEAAQLLAECTALSRDLEEAFIGAMADSGPSPSPSSRSSSSSGALGSELADAVEARAEAQVFCRLLGLAREHYRPYIFARPTRNGCSRPDCAAGARYRAAASGRAHTRPGGPPRRRRRRTQATATVGEAAAALGGPACLAGARELAIPARLGPARRGGAGSAGGGGGGGGGRHRRVPGSEVRVAEASRGLWVWTARETRSSLAAGKGGEASLSQGAPGGSETGWFERAPSRRACGSSRGCVTRSRGCVAQPQQAATRSRGCVTRGAGRLLIRGVLILAWMD